MYNKTLMIALQPKHKYIQCCTLIILKQGQSAIYDFRHKRLETWIFLQIVNKIIKTVVGDYINTMKTTVV